VTERVPTQLTTGGKSIVRSSPVRFTDDSCVLHSGRVDSQSGSTEGTAPRSCHPQVIRSRRGGRRILPCTSAASKTVDSDNSQALKLGSFSAARRRATVLLTSLFLLTVRESTQPATVVGQVAGASPAITLPAAPGQPHSFATIGALPQLAPAPGPALSGVPSPTPANQVFRCACNGPGYPTSWMGTISAANILAAEQAAPSACFSFKTSANAESPYITPPSNTVVGTGTSIQLPGTLYSGPPGSLATTVSVPPSVLQYRSSSATQQSLITSSCSRCSCD